MNKMRGSNIPSLQAPFNGDEDYEVGGYLNNSRHYDYNNAPHPDSPSGYSQLTTATRRDEEVEEDPDAPIIIRVIAPATLEEGYTIDVLYNDEAHTVDIPPGGVREGEEFETVIDPKRKYHDQYSQRSMGMDQLPEEEEEEEEISRRSSTYSRNEQSQQEEQQRKSRQSQRSDYSRNEQSQQEEQRRESRQSQRSDNSSNQMRSTKLTPANIYDDRSDYTEDTYAKTKEIEQCNTYPAHSLSGDNDEEEDPEERTHIQKPKTNDEDNNDGDSEAESKDKIWYDKNGAPHGTWRTRLFGCCDVLTQSTFWMGLFCTPVLMAQLITRLGLTWNGREGPPEETYLSYNRLVLAFVIVMGVYWIPILGTLCVFIYYLVVVVYIGSKVRGYMRNKYEIPSSLPTWCGSRTDDICVMLCCGCCSSIQMARHTHDDKDYPGHVCTTTGLEYDAHSIV